MSILLRNLKEIYHLKSSNFKLADLILEQEEADEEPEEENPFEDDPNDVPAGLPSSLPADDPFA